jgi:hypothetical protein
MAREKEERKAIELNPYAPPMPPTDPKSAEPRPNAADATVRVQNILRLLFLPVALFIIAGVPFVLFLLFAGTMNAVLGGSSLDGAAPAGLATGIGAALWVWLGNIIVPGRHRMTPWILWALGAALLLVFILDGSLAARQQALVLSACLSALFSGAAVALWITKRLARADQLSAPD